MVLYPWCGLVGFFPTAVPPPLAPLTGDTDTFRLGGFLGAVEVPLTTTFCGCQTLSSTVGILTGFRPGLICAGLAGTCGLFTATVGNGGGGSASRVKVELFPFLLIAPTTSSEGAVVAKTWEWLEEKSSLEDKLVFS